MKNEEKIKELFQIANIETKKQNSSKAIKAYEDIIALSQDDIRTRHIAHWGAGDVFLNNHVFDKAEYHLKKAIELEPTEHSYHYLLGCTYTYTNNIEKAVYHLEKAISFDNSIDIYWGQLGWVVGYKIDTEKGIEYLKKALKLNPVSAKLLKDICMLFAKIHKFGEALVCIEEALSIAPDNQEILEIKNQIEFFKNQFKRFI